MPKKSTVTPQGFPPPPDGLPPAQAELWRGFVTSFPPDFFKVADMPLLTELVRAVATANFLSGRIEQAGLDLEDLKRFLALRDVESRRAASLAKALRMAPSARYDRQAAAVSCRNTGKGPWRENPFAEFAVPISRSRDD